MRLHDISVSPRRAVLIDGVPLLVSVDGFSVRPIDSGIHEVDMTVFARKVVLEGDDHKATETTPIYDELTNEMAPCAEEVIADGHH